MSKQLRCSLCGCSRFRKVQESVVELFVWREGDEEYCGEQRVQEVAMLSTFACEQCGLKSPVSARQWVKLIAAGSRHEATVRQDHTDVHRDELKRGTRQPWDRSFTS